MTVNQFVRAYRLLPSAPRRPTGIRHLAGDGGVPAELWTIDCPVPLGADPDRRDASRRCSRRALTCLAAQSFEDLEVIVLVHGREPGSLESCQEVVKSFEGSFASRVRVEQVPGENRSVQLNAGLVLARGRYVAFLDEDDLVTSEWAQRFAKGSPGRRAGSSARS